jgi:hypothetical protein
MRCFALLLFSGILFAQKPPSVIGTVHNAQTGEPVARMSLSLRSNNAAQGPDVLWATSDDEGKFSFPEVAAGSYTVATEKAGYLRMVFTSKEARTPMAPFPVKPGSNVEKLTLYVQPQAVIVGRVVDEQGEPLERAMVQVIVQRNGQLQPQNGGPTNDLGEFRLAGLMPGKYYLVAQRQEMGPQRGRQAYQATFYPSAADFTSATPIELKAGQTSAPAQISLRRGSVFRVSGRVTGSWGRDQMARVSLMPRRAPAAGGRLTTFTWGGASGNVKPDGSFEIAGTSPGEYHVMLLTYGNGRPVELGRVPITVTQADLEDIQLPVQPPFNVRGKIRVEGDGEVAVEGMTVSLFPTEGGMGMAQGRADAAGAFTLMDVGRLPYRFNFRPIANTYLKKLLLGEKDVTLGAVDFSNGATELEVVLGTKPAALKGKVSRERDKQAPGQVILLPEGLSLADHSSLMLPGVQAFARVDEEGSFEFGGLPPGKYRLLAIEQYLYDGERPKEIVDKLEAKMTKVEIAEGATGTVALVQLSRKELADMGLDLGQ